MLYKGANAVSSVVKNQPTGKPRPVSGCCMRNVKVETLLEPNFGKFKVVL